MVVAGDAQVGAVHFGGLSGACPAVSPHWGIPPELALQGLGWDLLKRHIPAQIGYEKKPAALYK